MRNNSRDFSLIDVHEFDDTILSQEEILEYFFKPCNAVWFHDGNPAHPHAQLSSGLCSDGFINCGEVLSHEKLSRILAYQLFFRLWKRGVEADWVIGSDHAAATFSSKVAEEFALRLDMDVRHDFVERDPTDPSGKRMQWKRLTIEEGSLVLQVEELLTTGGTLQEVRRAVIEGNLYPIQFHPLKGTIVLRPERLTSEYDDVIALVRREIHTWRPEECPLCQAGSRRLRPKQNWQQLTEERKN